jgi:hypothetical protein
MAVDLVHLVLFIILIMKGIIPGVGALMTWTIIPGTGVHFFLVGCYPSTEAIIPVGGHLGYYPSTGGQIFLFKLLEDHDPWYGSPNFLSWLLS